MVIYLDRLIYYFGILLVPHINLSMPRRSSIFKSLHCYLTFFLGVCNGDPITFVISSSLNCISRFSLPALVGVRP